MGATVRQELGEEMSDGITEGHEAADHFKRQALRRFGDWATETITARAGAVQAELEEAEEIVKKAEGYRDKVRLERDQLLTVMLERRRVVAGGHGREP
jgi:hypothetical protein